MVDMFTDDKSYTGAAASAVRKVILGLPLTEEEQQARDEELAQ